MTHHVHPNINPSGPHLDIFTLIQFVKQIFTENKVGTSHKKLWCSKKLVYTQLTDEIWREETITGRVDVKSFITLDLFDAKNSV